MTFNNKLLKICEDKDSHLCVGLDVDLSKIPSFLQKKDKPLFEFCKAIIDATQEFAAAFKINTAFFEAYGVAGWQQLADVLNYLPANTLKIADAKRADIGNSSKMYAQAFFKEFKFDALTVNPYLGYDGVRPFIEQKELGAFILCMTSNEGAIDFQMMSDGELFLYEKVAIKAMEWNDKQNCGLVVGATHPSELRKIRELAPDLPFLIPGIGAQGGDLESSVKYAITDHAGAIFNSSRAIIYSSTDKNFAQSAAEKAEELKTAINNLKHG